MSLEEMVEGWVNDYESHRSKKGSVIYTVSKAFIEFTNSQDGLRNLWDGFIGTLGNLFFKGHTPQRSMFHYLANRLPDLQTGGLHAGLYKKITSEIIVDELIVLFYLSGWLPRIINGKMVKLNSPPLLKLMSIKTAKLSGYEKDRREDQRFYRLVMRVCQRSHRRLGPAWNPLVNQVFQFMPDSTPYRPVKSFEEFRKNGYNFNAYIIERLRQYMAGEVQVNTPHGPALIFPLKNLELLRRGEIERGSDKTLKDLLSEAKYNREHGGKSFAECQDLAGELADVRAYHGTAVNSRIISGHPNESDDFRLFKAAVLGQIMVTYRGKRKRIRKIDDTYMALGFKEAFRKPSLCAKELIPVFRRSKTRYEKEVGRSPTQLMADVLADREVVAKYGSITPQDIYRFWIVHQFKKYLQPRALGRLPFAQDGVKTWIKPGENLHVLRPESKFVDDTLRQFYSKLRWHKRALGRGYWDIVEEVFADKKVVAYQGTALTRHDISPRALATVAV